MTIVKLWQNNLYDYENIPSSPDLISNYSYNLIQTVEITELNDAAKITRDIRIQMDDINKASNVKFISIENASGEVAWYDVLGWTPLNAYIVSYNIELNPFLSWGIFENTGNVNNTGVEIKGIANRLTPQHSYDNNELTEDWTPSRKMNSTIIQPADDSGTHLPGFPRIETDPSGGGFYDLIALTINPEDAESVSNVLASYDTGTQRITNYEIKPRQISLATPTTFTAYNPICKRYVNFWYSGVGVYFASFRTGTGSVGFTQEPNHKLDFINSLGLNSAVLVKWEVPNIYVEAPDFATSVKSGKVTKLKSDSKLENNTLDITLQNVGGTAIDAIYNLKALTYFTTITAQGQSSGDKKTWRFTDISPTGIGSAIPTTKTGAKFYIMVDPSFNGKPYLISDYQNGKKAVGILGDYVVTGSTWLRPITAVEGASGRDLTNYNSQVSLTEQRAGLLGGLTSGMIGVVSGLAEDDAGKAIGSAMQGITSVINYKNNTTEIRNNQAIKNAVYTPATYGSADMNSAQQITGNNFLVTLNALQTSDLYSFDRYLTAYGYADNTYIGAAGNELSISQTIQNRGAHFCYIQMNNPTVSIRNNRFKDAKAYIIRRLRNGIRVWKDDNENGYKNNSKDTPGWNSNYNK